MIPHFSGRQPLGRPSFLPIVLHQPAKYRMVHQIKRWMMLCEAELSDLVFQKAAEGVIDRIDWSGGDGETVMLMMGHDPEEELDTDSPQFQAALMAWAKERVLDAFEEIDYHFRGADVLRVYRMITAPPDWKPDPAQHPGEYWSWKPEAADAHWGSFGNGHVKWLLTADVDTSQVDWVQTLAANGAPSTEQEAEITVRPDAPIQLLSYKRVK